MKAFDSFSHLQPFCEGQWALELHTRRRRLRHHACACPLPSPVCSSTTITRVLVHYHHPCVRPPASSVLLVHQHHPCAHPPAPPVLLIHQHHPCACPPASSVCSSTSITRVFTHQHHPCARPLPSSEMRTTAFGWLCCHFTPYLCTCHRAAPVSSGPQCSS